jgi:hypothetical protein
MLTEAKLREIENRCNAAQRGPWMVAIGKHIRITIGSHDEPVVRILPELLPPEIGLRASESIVQDDNGYVISCPEVEISKSFKKTCEFVAHSRTDIPKLIAELRCLKEENAKLKKSV